MRHLTTADFERVRNGDLSADDAEALGRHVAECSDCAAQATRSLDLNGAADAFDAAFALDEVAEDEPARFPRRTVVWAGAVAAAIAIVLFLFPREESPSPRASRPVPRVTAAPVPVPVPAHEPRSSRPAEWDALLTRTRETGVLPFPAEIRELGLVTTVRGESPRAARERVKPAATAIDEIQPEFRWPTANGARYTVTVIADGSEVASSGPLTAARWRIPIALRRGRMYRWQVTVERGSESFVLPAPPAPPAIFRVLAADEHEALKRARREAGGDHLLLALLYARAGVVDEARSELAASPDPLARRLLQQLPDS